MLKIAQVRNTLAFESTFPIHIRFKSVLNKIVFLTTGN